jgi:hypothetical protein
VSFLRRLAEFRGKRLRVTHAVEEWLGAVGGPHVVKRGGIPNGLENNHREADGVRLWACSSIEVQTSERVHWAHWVRDMALFSAMSLVTILGSPRKKTYGVVSAVDVDPVPAPIGGFSVLPRLNARRSY